MTSSESRHSQSTQNPKPRTAATGGLKTWVEAYLPEGFDPTEALALTPLTGDAGFRYYFRVNCQPSLIAVLSPPAQEDNPAFVRKALAMRAGGVHVPVLHAVDFQRGFMLQEDLGNDLFLHCINGNKAERLYDQAEAALLRIQQLPADDRVFPAYSEALLNTEMALFPTWFLQDLLALTLDKGEQQMLDDLFRLLVTNALQQPQVVVHRDYHSRNLLALHTPGGAGRAAGDLGVVDFQDAVVGAVTYDLVSLLKDCYIRWPSHWVRARALGFAAVLRSTGLLTDVADDRFLRWFDLMGLQRHIKVLGIFARLWLRDGKSRYLDDLPLVIRYSLEVAHRYPETRDFAVWFEQSVLPVLPRQRWYQPWETAGE